MKICPYLSYLGSERLFFTTTVLNRYEKQRQISNVSGTNKFCKTILKIYLTDQKVFYYPLFSLYCWLERQLFDIILTRFSFSFGALLCALKIWYHSHNCGLLYFQSHSNFLLHLYVLQVWSQWMFASFCIEGVWVTVSRF